MLSRFSSVADANRVLRTLRKLGRHDIHGWALTGGLAVEVHRLRRGCQPSLRAVNDIDFIADSFDRIPETLGNDFLFRHIHPCDPPNRTMLQLVDPESKLRIDVFRSYGDTMCRTYDLDVAGCLIKLISLEDLTARTARLALDLAAGVPTPSKHATDFICFFEMAARSRRVHRQVPIALARTRCAEVHQTSDCIPAQGARSVRLLSFEEQMKIIYLAIVVTFTVSLAEAQSANCPVTRTMVYIGEPSDQAKQISDLIKGVTTANTTVLLGPNVKLDFSSVPDSALPIQFARCVTLTSAAGSGAADGRRSIANRNRVGTTGTALAGAFPSASPSARTPGSPGPVIYYGKHPNRPFKDASDVAFLEARCSAGLDGEGAQMSGFRVIGPDPGDQRTFETGINIMDCQDVEISNMEIANWGGTAVKVQNPAQGAVIPNRDPAAILVRIHDNFIHNNQHSSNNGKAEGYGVGTSVAAWASIYQNVFDNNRHSIQADGNTGGYRRSVI